MSKVYVFMADGTEEVEALTVVDLLLRAGASVNMVSIMQEKQITGAHNIGIRTDFMFKDADYQDGDMLVLPGGMPGTTHLMEHEGLRTVIKKYASEQKYVAAICAAPSVLGVNGLLQGKHATCYPGFEDKLQGATVVTDPVVRDGNIITSRGLGTAIEFALELITLLVNKETADRIAAGIQFK